MSSPQQVKPTSTIAIVEDDTSYAQLLKKTLSAHPNWIIKGPYSTADEATRQLTTVRSDLILLDINLPDGLGIDVARELRARSVETPIVMLTIIDDAETIVKALEAGAQGYLLKGANGEDLRQEVESILNGAATMSPAIARRLVQWFNHRESHQPASNTALLTERQKELLTLAARGASQKQIAQHLKISTHTVKNHFRNIYEKLGVHSVREALVKVKGTDSLLEL